MSKTAITSPELTSPVGPFFQAIEVGGFLYFSGQVPQDPTSGVSSGEVIGVLLMANSCGSWVSEYGTYAAKNQHLQEK